MKVYKYIYMCVCVCGMTHVYNGYHPTPKSLHKTLGQTTENGQTLGKWGGMMLCIGGEEKKWFKSKKTHNTQNMQADK